MMMGNPLFVLKPLFAFSFLGSFVTPSLSYMTYPVLVQRVPTLLANTGCLAHSQCNTCCYTLLGRFQPS